MGEKGESNARIQGLDSMRFICGLSIVIYHYGGLVPTSYLGNGHGLFAAITRGTLSSLFNGPAALIIFFVISGFGIHFASRKDLTVNVPSFWSRRLIRAGGPALIAFFLWVWSGVQLSPEEPGPFWSLICEIEYYLLYPLLLILRRRFGWWPMILVGQIVAYGFAFAHVPDIQKWFGGYASFGPWNWVMGLPCFLVGCWLAESFQRFPQPSTKVMWLVRGFVFALSVAIEVVRFHTGSIYFSNPFTLNLFAMVACFWLGLEVAYRRKHPAPRVLEWAGNWTYSLYLVHPAVPGLLVTLIWLRPVLTSVGGSLFAIGCAVVLAYPFHLAVEAPFYRLAIKVSRRLKSGRPAVKLPVQEREGVQATDS
jgi:peptidoglycan/LPS O-acetylase OafA/YrhL